MFLIDWIHQLNCDFKNLCVFQEGPCYGVFLWSAPTKQNPQTEVQRLWLWLQEGELLVQQQSNNPSQWDQESSQCQWSWSHFVSCKRWNRACESVKLGTSIYLSHIGTSASVLPIKVPIHMQYLVDIGKRSRWVHCISVLYIESQYFRIYLGRFFELAALFCFFNDTHWILFSHAKVLTVWFAHIWFGNGSSEKLCQQWRSTGGRQQAPSSDVKHWHWQLAGLSIFSVVGG